MEFFHFLFIYLFFVLFSLFNRTLSSREHIRHDFVYSMKGRRSSVRRFDRASRAAAKSVPFIHEKIMFLSVRGLGDRRD